MPKEVSRVIKVGSGRAIYLPKKIYEFLAWRDGDRVVISVLGSKLVVERIPLEELASIKFATAEVAR